MTHAETLKSMLQSIINDRHEEASVTMHEYFVSKTKEVAGLAETDLSEEEVEEILESATEEELEEAVRASIGVEKEEGGRTGHDFRKPESQAERDEVAKTIKSQRRTNKYIGTAHTGSEGAKTITHVTAKDGSDERDEKGRLKTRETGALMNQSTAARKDDSRAVRAFVSRGRE